MPKKLETQFILKFLNIEINSLYVSIECKETDTPKLLKFTNQRAICERMRPERVYIDLIS